MYVNMHMCVYVHIYVYKYVAKDQKAYTFYTRTGGLAQVIEHQPSKHKALISNLSITKKKKKKPN
jgi:hypothetical protein